MLVRQLYISAIQIEDFNCPTAINISLKIIRVIFTLLSSGTTDSKTLKYVTRGTYTSMGTYKLECDNQMFNYCDIPFLSNLRALPLLETKEILSKTLGITDEFLNKFCPEWRIYIAALNYWMNEAEAKFRTNCHMYSLLFVLLYHVIDSTVGSELVHAYIERNDDREIKMLQKNRINISLHRPMANVSLLDPFGQVNRKDCLLALPFFKSNSNIDKTLLLNPGKFDKSIVHAFSLFQNCIYHTAHLNALLGYPYERPTIVRFFNGNLMYNLYKDFKQQSNIDNYITTIFKNSPSFLQLFISITSEATFKKK